MSITFDIAHLREFGWVRIHKAIPVELCNRLVEVLETELRVPVNDPSRWDNYGGEPRDFVPIWGHQAQWEIRQHTNLHRIWARLYGTERLFVSLDSCRFTPPWKPGHAEPYGIHWDHDPRNAEKRMFQGVLALTDTGIDQGGFRCVPSLYSAHGPASQLLMLMAKIGSPTSPGARLRMCERRLATSSYGIRCSHTATRRTCRRDLALPFMS